MLLILQQSSLQFVRRPGRVQSEVSKTKQPFQPAEAEVEAVGEHVLTEAKQALCLCESVHPRLLILLQGRQVLSELLAFDALRQSVQVGGCPEVLPVSTKVLSKDVSANT